MQQIVTRTAVRVCIGPVCVPVELPAELLAKLLAQSKMTQIKTHEIAQCQRVWPYHNAENQVDQLGKRGN